jgi:hypothetical protein
MSKLEDYLRLRISPDEHFGALLGFPRFLEIETVNACNARCPMCTIADWERRAPIMKDGLFEKIAGDIDRHASVVKRVSLYRDGEPLLDKKLARRVRRLKEGGVRKVSIATNVALLDEERSVDLLHAGLDHVILSIDSLKKDVYESIRVGLNLETVMANALRFIDLRDKIRPGTEILVRMIAQESNRDEWPEYERFWRLRVGAMDRVYFHNIHNWGTQLSGFKPVAYSYEPNLPCVALWSLLVIFANGDVPLCNVDYNNKHPTGSVLTHSIAELWQSKIMDERRKLHLKGEKSCIAPCAKCNVWDEPESASPFISNRYAAKVPLVG